MKVAIYQALNIDAGYGSELPHPVRPLAKCVSLPVFLASHNNWIELLNEEAGENGRQTRLREKICLTCVTANMQSVRVQKS